jgi:two-component system chemotaxis response regulator CheB
VHRDRAPIDAPPFDLVAIAASAGGLSALMIVLAHLPATFPLPLAIVQHVAPVRKSLLVEILARHTPLVVRAAAEADVMNPGEVYIAPPGSHLEVTNGLRIALTHSKPLHFVRPSADRLFQSAASACGRLIAVVLTGTGVDGADGVQAVKACGGFVIVQDPRGSAFAGMPQAAIGTGVVDRVLPLARIADELMDLAGVTAA